MMTPQEIRHCLTPMNISKVSRETGLHFNTVYRLKTGKITNPSFETLRRLSDYLKEQTHE